MIARVYFCCIEIQVLSYLSLCTGVFFHGALIVAISTSNIDAEFSTVFGGQVLHSNPNLVATSLIIPFCRSEDVQRAVGRASTLQRVRIAVPFLARRG